VLTVLLLSFYKPLKDFVKSLGSKLCDLKGMFAYETIDTNNYSFVLVEKRTFVKYDFKSYLKNGELSDKEYKEYIEEWNRI
jgi:hypothetical protein